MSIMGCAPKPRGFSLVELLVTLAIVAVLAAICVPAYQDYVLRTRLVQAFEFADAARTSVIVDTIDGPVPKTDHRFMNLDPARSNALVDLSWFKSAEGSGFRGYLLASVALTGNEAKDVVKAFALEWRDNGNWYCVPGGTHGGNKAKPMDEKYLPAICREGNGSALAAVGSTAAVAPTCPPGQDLVVLTSAGKTNHACTPQCAAGQSRDAVNPVQCNSPAGTARRPGAAGEASIQCHVCDPALPELCELVTVETTCTAPNNFCMTFVDNHADGTKSVQRSCGNFERARLEWWQGTSDDDKCRERIDVDQRLDFTCTFACEKDNCNQSGRSLRPDVDSLYQDK